MLQLHEMLTHPIPVLMIIPFGLHLVGTWPIGLYPSLGDDWFRMQSLWQGYDSAGKSQETWFTLVGP